MQSELNKYPIYGVLGNHDTWNILKQYKIYDLSEQFAEIDKVTFTGLYGSLRYKEG